MDPPASAPSAPSPSRPATTGVHLLVYHNGLWGHHTHLDHLISVILRTHPTVPIEPLSCPLNVGTLTYAGLDVLGARLASLIIHRLTDLSKPAVTDLSVVGYSMGGLVVRYAMGVLYARGWLTGRGSVRTRVFATFATPHLGTKLMAWGTGWQGGLLNWMASGMGGRSGAQMLIRDVRLKKKKALKGKKEEVVEVIAVEEELVRGRPMLAILADPRLPFWKALEAFERRIVYANLINDRLVTYESSSVLAESPFDGTLSEEIRYVVSDPRYPSIVVPGVAPAPNVIPPTPDLLTEPSTETDALRPPANATTAIKKKEPWTTRRVVFTALSPVLVVVGLVYLSGYYAVSQVCNLAISVNEWRTGRLELPPHVLRDEDREIERSLPPLWKYKRVDRWLSGWVEREGAARVPLSRFEGGAAYEAASENTWGFAAWGLGLLKWERVHVKISIYRAHAAIIRRSEQFAGFEDVVQHFADRFLSVEHEVKAQ
ncbi:hypothetical protein HK101_003259 [Irineochytrium annulatum]|nr:hypothetical protein HK101_003259 [Irineochytrium annulatum]